MGTSALLTIYDKSNGVYHNHFIRRDGLLVLRYLRIKFLICKSIKSLTKAINKYMKENPGMIDLETSNQPYPEKKYWPYIEYSMNVETADNTTHRYFNNAWDISPIFETMEKSLELAKGQRKEWINKHVHYAK